MSKHDLINGLNDVANYMERASMANKMKNVELKVRLEEMAADEARHARELRRLAKGN